MRFYFMQHPKNGSISIVEAAALAKHRKDGYLFSTGGAMLDQEGGDELPGADTIPATAAHSSWFDHVTEDEAAAEAEQDDDEAEAEQDDDEAD